MERHRIKKTILMVFLLYGLFYFLEPCLSAWFEIVNPFIARNIFLPFDLIQFYLVIMPVASMFGNIAFYMDDIFFLVVFLAYALFYFRIVIREVENEQKKIFLTPFILFPLLLIVMLPLGFTATDRHLNSYPLGGWSLLMMAGGPALVRNDALQLMNSTSAKEPSWSEYPSSLKKVGGWIIIEHENRLIVLGRGAMFNMADQFGFIFQEENNVEPNSNYLQRYEFRRFWKLDDGVYLWDAD